MSTFELQHKHTSECGPMTCPCTPYHRNESGNVVYDSEPHLFPDDHRELEDVGMYCLKCKDWCVQY